MRANRLLIAVISSCMKCRLCGDPSPGFSIRTHRVLVSRLVTILQSQILMFIHNEQSEVHISFLRPNGAHIIRGRIRHITS